MSYNITETKFWEEFFLLSIIETAFGKSLTVVKA